MLALAGARLGFDVHIFCPEEDAPASRVAARTVIGQYDDLDAVRRFAWRCDVVTYEFENVPINTAMAAAEKRPVRPEPQALEVAQDRVIEKRFARSCGADTVAFEPVENAADVARAAMAVGMPALLKTRRMGYDGKGQAWIRSPSQIAEAAAAIGDQQAILEKAAPFVRELSLICARGADGAFAAYDLVENRHEDGILRETTAPATVAAEATKSAHEIAQNMMERFAYVGVLAIEFFELEGGALLVNEIAPRVHNTGHWTMDATGCDQFEQHMRAVAGWPLGDPSATASAVMTNLLGDEVEQALEMAKSPDVRIHLYGKREARPGRKMGHATRIAPLSQ